ncbi:DUF488 family protein [Phenylobacterium deserti]|uniref:DUF488 domain-containing protein n=1 Tax=Phenylobacterium deserti TaxID=1914756 RepID=A0A328AX84_9CAUL|nr:DUF488 domain-containing protein [Phenylobacterium deserti]RAK57468.1 DUF488 domain-containing protein [Phenylobacterium deserti]
MSRLTTIGYENETQAAVIERLKQAGVEVVVDVRAVAASRRAGFSKTLLAASLNEAGIGYVHLRQLGTPKPGRDAARKGHVAEMRAIFEDHLAEPGAQLELAKAAEMAREKTIALLCYEADACGCHRAIVADRICEAIGCEIENL